jgi:predicted Zn-ribbon and HTH transcriptional regulator
VGFLSRVIGRSSPPRTAAPSILYPGDETLEVVGESFHQDVLWRLVGGRTITQIQHEIRALLVPEPTNPKDPNAVMIVIEGHCVGHLAREDAAAYLPGIQRLLARGGVELSGGIYGGGQRDDGIGFLGVFLDHNPLDFGIPETGRSHGSEGFRTGFSEAVASDYADDSYDLSWYLGLSSDHAIAAGQLRRMLAAESDPIDRHYMLSELTKRLYKCRDTNPAALDEFDAACRDHDAEMDVIRVVLFTKFGKVPVIETYRQAAIRCQKAKDWPAVRDWAERGINVYGKDAARPEVIEDLRKRLALALAKIEAAANPQPRRRSSSRASTATETVIETLVCSRCGLSFQRIRSRGRKPNLCPDCRSAEA